MRVSACGRDGNEFLWYSLAFMLELGSGMLRYHLALLCYRLQHLGHFSVCLARIHDSLNPDFQICNYSSRCYLMREVCNSLKMPSTI